MKNEKLSVYVVGGGAAGLAAAIHAARAGASVTVLERETKPGKKLLRTGNGRCNLANMGPVEDAYHGLHPDFAASVLAAFPRERLLAFFEETGIHVRSYDGWLYPSSESAESVLACLLMTAEALKVRIRTNTCVKRIEKSGERFLIDVGSYVYTGDRVIITAGSQASLEGNSGQDILHLVSAFGHTIVPTHPSLVPLTVKDASSFGFAGVRVRGVIRMYADGELFHEEAGQLQLTKDGISGIPVFNGSGRAVLALSAGRTVTAEADFFPDMEEAVFISYLKDRFLRLNRRTDAEKLKGLIPERLIPAVLMGAKNPEDIALRIRHFPMTVTGSKGPSAAQVMSGGVDTAEVDPSTMESRLIRGLYLAGEILDIDGNCGGYNLMFAFAGGALAGKAQGDCT